MVNRKSKSANFLQHGSPRKKLMEQMPTNKAKNKNQKKKKNKKPLIPISWEDAKEYFQKLEDKRTEINERRKKSKPK